MRSPSSNTVCMSTSAPGDQARSLPTASMPERPGSSTSSSTTSGAAAGSERAASAEPKLPAHAKAGRAGEQHRERIAEGCVELVTATRRGAGSATGGGAGRAAGKGPKLSCGPVPRNRTFVQIRGGVIGHSLETPRGALWADAPSRLPPAASRGWPAPGAVSSVKVPPRVRARRAAQATRGRCPRGPSPDRNRMPVVSDGRARDGARPTPTRS